MIGNLSMMQLRGAVLHRERKELRRVVQVWDLEFLRITSQR